MAILSILRVLMFLVASFKGEKRKTLTSLEQVLSFIYLGCNPLGDRTEGKRCEWKRKAFFHRPLGMVPFTTLLKFICLFALFLQRVMYFLQLFSLVPLFFSFFSVLFCHTASSPIPFLPSGTSFLSCVGCGPPPSPTSIEPDVWSSTDPLKVVLLQPFLNDQAQHVSARGPFHLFCQATGKLEEPCVN